MRLNPNDFADAFEAGTFLRRYCKPGSRSVEIEPGRIDISADVPGTPMNWKVPPGIKLDLHERAVLVSNCANAGDGCCLQLNDGVEVRGGSLEVPTKDHPTFANGQRHCCAIGIGGKAAYNRVRTSVRHMRISGGNFQGYLWNAMALNVWAIFEDDTFVGGRWLGLNGNSGGSNAMLVEFRRCRFDGDFALGWSDPADALGNRLHAVTARGGVTVVDDCVMQLVGAPEATDVRGIYTCQTTSPPGRQPDYEGAAPDTYVRSQANLAVLIRNGAKNIQLVEQGAGQILTID